MMGRQRRELDSRSGVTHPFGRQWGNLLDNSVVITMCLLFFGLLLVFLVKAEDVAFITSESLLKLTNLTAAAYPIPTGSSYKKPTGLCYYTPPQVYGCSCYDSVPVVLISAGNPIDAVCAPTCTYAADCPYGPPGTFPACKKGVCFLSCEKDYTCPWPGRCEATTDSGDLCFFPQWAGQ
ncbi:hypothetical protein FOZ62_023190 [Perkinsus olseni]|uniref:Uncharacterized protein n=1 Tax=Perkinsus olseni TaxID=32597 RepID=A0A7J6Q5A6_PEROL|nr:hypothetical protein FOZ62_023190 [Perkinsus olseni]